MIEMSKAAFAISKLESIIERLRSPQGCPWDAEQTSLTLKPFLLEETYEVLEALDEGIPSTIKDELGDLLLQIVFHAQIFKEQKLFDLSDVADSVSNKMIRRHPHVFGEVPVPSNEDLHILWDRIKKNERSGHESDSIFAGIPSSMPALARAKKVLERFYREKTATEDIQEVLEKVFQNLTQIDQMEKNGNPALMEKFLGETLLALTKICLLKGVDPEDALRRTTNAIMNNFVMQGNLSQPDNHK